MKLLKSKAISILISLFIFAIFTFIYTILVYNGKIEAKTNDIYRFSIIIGANVFLTSSVSNNSLIVHNENNIDLTKK